MVTTLRFFVRLALSVLFASLAEGQIPGVIAKPRPNILVVHSYHIGMPWADGVTTGLADRLRDKAEIVITQLDTQRFPNADFEGASLQVLSAKAKISHPQIVVAIDDYAYRFALKHRDLFPLNTPIVFGGVNFWDGERVTNTTGVVEAIDIASTVKLILALNPQLHRLVVVNDLTETGRANQKAFEAAFPKPLPLEVAWLGRDSFEATESTLARLDPQRDAVLLLSWNLDRLGATRSYETAAMQAHSSSTAPLYGVWDFYFGHGIVGGQLLDGRTHGQEVGELVDRILSGEKADAIPVITRCRTRLAVDFRELQHFGIPLKRVPLNAEVAYREYDFWERNSGLIILVFAIFSLQAATISWLIFSNVRRRQAKERLRESEENLRLTLDSIDEAVIVTSLDSRIRRINLAAEKLTGWSFAEADGAHVSQVLPLADPQTRRPLCFSSIGTLSRAKPVRAILKNRNGEDCIVVHSAAPMLGKSGAACGTVLVVRDVTVQQQLEEQLQQAKKMESIGQLAGGIAHDFNNILAGIVAYGELLRDQLIKQPKAMEDLEMILRGAQRAADLVQQILAFSRKTKHEMTPTLIQNVVTEALKFLRSTVPATIEISAKINPDLPLVLADSIQIHQILMNLASNAVHAMRGAPGRLEFLVDSQQADAEFVRLHTGLREGEYVCLTVSDTGHGMDEAILRHIFEPFFTTKNPGEGTGLGLSVVHGIVKAHHGEIFAQSAPTKGAVFQIYLPALSIANDTAVAPLAGLPRGNNERILFVDDEPAVCTAARRLGEHLGYRMTTFLNPLSAIDYFRQNPQEFDLVLTDLTMPGATGLDLALAVSKIRADIPIILATGYAADLKELTVHPRGIRKLILKPFTAAVFADALSQTLNEARIGSLDASRETPDAT